MPSSERNISKRILEILQCSISLLQVITSDKYLKLNISSVLHDAYALKWYLNPPPQLF